MKKRKRNLDLDAWTMIMVYYVEMCVQRGYHPRFIGRRMREFEDAFDRRDV